MNPMQPENPPAERHMARAKENPLGWFDDLYKDAQRDSSLIPWGDENPNANLTSWAKAPAGAEVLSHAKTALVVGCGLGDDAEFLAGIVPEVQAFDISPTAIAWARERFPQSRVNYSVQDLFAAQTSCDFVFEAYTVQALPLDLREQAVKALIPLVKPGGALLIVCRGRDDSDTLGEKPPWPLSRADLKPLESALKLEAFEDYADPAAHQKGVRRFRLLYRK